MRTVCVLFLDIRGFTAMTRTRPADETVALLNDFFAEMIEIVDRHNGIINKFLGDGFLALFGAPLADPAAAANALAAARGMLDAVDAWNRDRPAQALRIGIGIHIGEAVTGTVGSPRRKEYTVIGDTVNLAARLEQLTKETGSRLLVSDAGARDAAASRRRDRSRAAWRSAATTSRCGYGGWHDVVFRLRLEHGRRAPVRGSAEAEGRRSWGARIGGPARRLAPHLRQAWPATPPRRAAPATSSTAPGEIVHGTLNALPAEGFDVLDIYEGVAGGHYERRSRAGGARRHRRDGRGDHLCGAEGRRGPQADARLSRLLLAGRDLLPADYWERLNATPTID